MNLCGMLVHAKPAKQAAVVAALRALAGVEVHRTADGGRIVITVEDAAGATALDTMASIHRLDGVVAASLVYHHFDPASDAEADLAKETTP